MMSKPLKIAVTGPESCGKTTLALQLAEHLGYSLVEEVSRSFLSNRVGYSIQDVLNIAAGQQTAEVAATLLGRGVVCDTDATVLWVWCEVKYGLVPDCIRDYFNSSIDVDLYLLCSPDLPWEADPLREHPEDRQMLFEHYTRLLAGKPVAVVSGQGKARFEAAMRAVEQIKTGPKAR